MAKIKNYIPFREKNGVIVTEISQPGGVKMKTRERKLRSCVK
jgi:hypothetical protein